MSATNKVRPEVFEIFQEFAKSKTRKERIAVLKKYDRVMALRDVLQGTFDPRVEWNLPNGSVPYTPEPEKLPAPNSIHRAHLNFKYFVRGMRESENLLPVKREVMFLNILESVHPEDAEILVSMINKKPPVAGLTKKIVQEAIPELIPN